jgi:hypothetical protein
MKTLLSDYENTADRIFPLAALNGVAPKFRI